MKQGILLFDKKDIDKLYSSLLYLYENTSEERITWVIVTDEFTQECIPWTFIVLKKAQEIGFFLKNQILTIDPSSDNQMLTHNMVNNVLMLVKTKNYYFNKDPIREKHMWKGKEWGKGKRKNGKRPYNEKGKDPSNVWLRTEKNEEMITQYYPLTTEEIINRMLISSGKVNDELIILGQHPKFTPYIIKTKLRKISFHALNKIVECNQTRLIINNQTRQIINNQKQSINSASFQNQIFYRNSEVMEEIPNNAIDLVITSPPYWGLRDYGHEGEFGKEKKYDEYLENLDKVWDECFRVLKEDGTFWLNINRRSKNGDIVHIPADFYFRCTTIGFRLVDVIYWYKRASVAGLTKKNLVDKFEFVLIFEKKKVRDIHDTNYCINDFQFEHDHKNDCNIWKMDQIVGSLANDIDKMVRGRKEIPGYGILKQPHTALFPKDLVERALSIATNSGDIVLDPFMGTGTTAQVAKEMDRKYVGYEINISYKPIIDYRLKQIRSLTSLEDYF